MYSFFVQLIFYVLPTTELGLGSGSEPHSKAWGRRAYMKRLLRVTAYMKRLLRVTETCYRAVCSMSLPVTELLGGGVLRWSCGLHLCQLVSVGRLVFGLLGLHEVVKKMYYFRPMSLRRPLESLDRTGRL